MAGSLRSNEHEILGFPALLPENVLPTKSDVRKRILLSKETFATKVTVAKLVQPVTVLPDSFELNCTKSKCNISLLHNMANCFKLRAPSNQQVLDRRTDHPTNGPTNQQSGL